MEGLHVKPFRSKTLSYQHLYYFIYYFGIVGIVKSKNSKKINININTKKMFVFKKNRSKKNEKKELKPRASRVTAIL